MAPQRRLDWIDGYKNWQEGPWLTIIGKEQVRLFSSVSLKYIVSVNLIDSMERSPFERTNILSGSKQFFRIWWTLKIYYYAMLLCS
jgi:hypothetical protein